MKNEFKRSSGVVMPIFSLPSPYGIGTFGKAAYEFVDNLKNSGQSYWQILPLGHTGFGESPYKCFSVVAGNPYFIDLDLLVDQGLLTKEFILNSGVELNYENIDYKKILNTRLKILHKAFENISEDYITKIESFKNENSDWIYDYSLFMAVKKCFKNKPFWEWDDKQIVKRNPKTIEYYSNVLKNDIDFYIFIQYLFFEQWNNLKTYTNSNGIKFIGDIPMYPSADSVDVWVNPNLFKLKENLSPNKVAGVPPDCYCETGQLWGNPIYNWEEHKKQNYSWWMWRIKHTLNMSDVIRIDHFRAFQSYWEIPADDDTAINGTWQPGPGIEFFNELKKQLGDVPIIAEDLGFIDESVRELLKQTGYPGMKVMVFGLYDGDDSIHLPHNWEKNTIGYTSTHDSETFCEHINEFISEKDKEFAINYINYTHTEPLGFCGIRCNLASPANLSMILMPDILSLGSEARINIPSTININWKWRMKPGAFTKEYQERLYNLTKTYKRL